MSIMRVCPACGNQMTMPIPGRRTGLWISRCRNAECRYTERSATPLTSAPAPRVERPRSIPVEGSHPAPAVVSAVPKSGPPSAIARFEEAHLAGTTRQVINQVRREQRAAAGADGRSKQLGGDR